MVRAARRPVFGADKVARLLLGISGDVPGAVTASLADVNGQPGYVVYSDGKLFTVFEFEVRDGRINDMFIVVNPHKLAGLEKGIVR